MVACKSALLIFPEIPVCPPAVWRARFVGQGRRPVKPAAVARCLVMAMVKGVQFDPVANIKEYFRR